MPTPIEVLWKDGQRGSWCQAIVEWLTEGFTHRMDCEKSHIRGEGAIVVVKADQIKDIDELNRYVAQLKWVLLVVTANEDGTWQWNQFRHPNSLVWLQTPHRHQHAHHVFPWGWTPGCPVDSLPWVNNDHWEMLPRPLAWSFAGQMTHGRREECVRILRELFDRHPSQLHITDGFGKGILQEEYYKMLGQSKVAPCPSGPVTVDSFRVCEALQLGAIPVVDTISPTGAYLEYWNRVFGAGAPLFWIFDWDEFPKRLDCLLACWDTASQEVQQWWTHWKFELKLSFDNDLRQLGVKL